MTLTARPQDIVVDTIMATQAADMAEKEAVKAPAAGVAVEPSTSPSRAPSSISDVVAGLNEFQQQMKEKLRSPEHRKPGLPKVRRKLDTQQHSQPAEPEASKPKGASVKSNQSMPLGRGATPAVGSTSVPKESGQPRSRAGSVQGSPAASISGSASARALRRPSPEATAKAGKSNSSELVDKEGGSEKSGGGAHARKPSKAAEGTKSRSQEGQDGNAELEWKKLAEERVKARKLEEAAARKEQLRKEQEEKKARHEASEARAKELEAAAKERIQARLRDERQKEVQRKEEETKQKKEREERAADQEEQRVKALKRAQERQQAEERRAQEEAEQEAKCRRRHHEESEAKAAELQERTRLRIQQREQELQERRLADEMKRRQQAEEEAAVASEREYQQQLSQERAKARAALFKQRLRHEEEERSRYEQHCEEQARLRAEEALRERQHKRQWRQYEASPCPESSMMRVESSVRSESPQPSTSDVSKEPVEQHPGGRPAQRSQPRRRAADVTALPKARMPPKPPLQQRSRHGADSPHSLGEAVEIVDHIWQPPVEEQPHASDDDGAIRVEVGFFGVGGVLDSDDDAVQDDGSALQGRAETPMGGQPMPHLHRPTHRIEGNYKSDKARSVGTAKRRSSRQGVPAVAAVEVHPSGIPRALSQPPPSLARQASDDGSRASTPASHDVPLPAPPAEGDHALSDMEEPEDMGGAALQINGGERPAVQESPSQARLHQRPAWKQKKIPLQSNDYYLDIIKGSRANGKADRPAANGSPMPVSGPSAWSDGPRGYASQLQRAAQLEVQQNEQEGRRMERGFAVLHRVQQRGLQAAPSRSVSADSALR